MLKQKNLLIARILVATALLTGCSKSDGFSTSKTSGTAGTSETNGTKATSEINATGDRTPDQEVIVINGHTLPPEPDPAVNDETLLGVDSNDNGVRDDVERWIYETYTEPVEIGLFMQSARAYQKVIVDPSKAYETKKYLDGYTSCVKYWMFRAKQKQEIFHIDKYRNLEKEIGEIMFNSIERHMAYERFNAELSGGVFSLLPISKDKCEFDENGILRD